MNYRFSESFADLRPSAIREILKHTSGSSVIPFAAGNPSPEAFPAEQLRAVTARITARPPEQWLQYGISEGYGPLRDLLKERLARRGLKKDSDDLIIVSGAQQGIDLAAQVFCDPGDAVICENPSFIGSLNAFRSHGIRLFGVPVREDGPDTEALLGVIKTQKRAKLLYLIPNFQNPTGITTSARKRGMIYEMARDHGLAVIEDDPYGDLRFAGADVPPMKTLDETGSVIYCGSFSKLIAPGMRVGYLLADSAVIAKVTVAKQAADVHTNLLAQITVHEFLTGGGLELHKERIRAVYRRKYGLMKKGLEENLPEGVSFTRPEGGLFVLVTLPRGANIPDLCERCLKNGLAIVPGSAFSVDPDEPCRTVRLNFSTPSDEQIIQGCRILGRQIKETELDG